MMFALHFHVPYAALFNGYKCLKMDKSMVLHPKPDVFNNHHLSILARNEERISTVACFFCTLLYNSD